MATGLLLRLLGIPARVLATAVAVAVAAAREGGTARAHRSHDRQRACGRETRIESPHLFRLLVCRLTGTWRGSAGQRFKTSKRYACDLQDVLPIHRRKSPPAASPSRRPCR